MKSKDLLQKALKKGKTLQSKTTRLYYKLIDGVLHSSPANMQYSTKAWIHSDLQFKDPCSWVNMVEVK